MRTDRQTEMVKHLSEKELYKAINEAQKSDETRIVRRLCFIKNVPFGDTNKWLHGVSVRLSQPVDAGSKPGTKVELMLFDRASRGGVPSQPSSD